MCSITKLGNMLNRAWFGYNVYICTVHILHIRYPLIRQLVIASQINAPSCFISICSNYV
jgi:hypothetical protein